ncbi:coiled-coil domain-containing protein 81-like [Plectropomus leopardus]|uniref:coiled-coil domain-containing protein 81-like n=1 Tax=Plectropomus leopardus TaxID=160734 RepID=UPI001C4AEE1C|nr:coiled-coil domain-containing protein 81-like [Plectropomus leopardus]
MTDILRLVPEADRRILPTLSRLSENDINCIWADVSGYIERHMTLQKGVHLAGLGTFTFSQQKLDIGNKFRMIQRPIFLLTGKLVQSLGLKQVRPLAAGEHILEDEPEGLFHHKLICEVPQQRESKSHQPLQPATMKAVSLSEELNPNPPMEATDKPSASTTPPEVTPKLEEARGNVSCSGHTRAGQELCYLCMQRALRNVPVYLREQQQAEEKAQEKLLLLKEQQRDKQYMDREQEKLNEQREHAKQVATFNLQMSEKKEKIPCPLLPTSFVFPARPLTPARRIQQYRYKNDLQSQIETRRQHEARDQQNRQLMERLDQVQLVQEVALQRAQQLQQKHERTTHYKKALDAQVEDKKSTDPPECQAENSRFNRCETPASNTESLERAQKLFQVNFSTATQRKKEELDNRQKQLEKEREILKNNKMELILDRINHFEKRKDFSKSLRDEWGRSAKLKHQREEEERRFLRSAGQLLVDKLAQYRRCCQCKRRTTNCGETNIWKDSHYLSGSQFMI